MFRKTSDRVEKTLNFYADFKTVKYLQKGKEIFSFSIFTHFIKLIGLYHF
jgi:hypothetical protein